jgi:hypothetical protein
METGGKRDGQEISKRCLEEGRIMVAIDMTHVENVLAERNFKLHLSEEQIWSWELEWIGGGELYGTTIAHLSEVTSLVVSEQSS